MPKQKLIITLFILVVLLQLIVPAKMIYEREDIISTGKEYKFKTAPIDPSDVFRGKYIILNYLENTVKVQKIYQWMHNANIYLTLATDKNGYAKVQTITMEKPTGNTDFIKVKTGYVNHEDKTLFIDYPFNRFYMEESKAYDAEMAYNESLRDTSNITYGLVSIKNGEAVLRDVLIGETSIIEIARRRKKNAQ